MAYNYNFTNANASPNSNHRGFRSGAPAGWSPARGSGDKDEGKDIDPIRKKT
jgi:hypothetical protein